MGKVAEVTGKVPVKQYFIHRKTYVEQEKLQNSQHRWWGRPRRPEKLATDKSVTRICRGEAVIGEPATNALAGTTG